MKKSLFYWAFLVLAGMSLTACSSGDDNIADNTAPVTPGSQNKTVILTGTIGVGGDETRAVDNNGVTSWAEGDQIAINYQKTDGNYARTSCEITKVSADKHYATFTATLTDPMNDGNIGFAYPYQNVTTPAVNETIENASYFKFNYSEYATQNGATTGTNSISDKRLDYACTENGGEVKMAVDNEGKATLKSTAKLRNQFSMFEFTLVKEGATSTNVPATELQIWVGESTFSSTPKYTITPDNSAPTSKFYVALEPTADNTTIDKVKIVASFDGKDPAIKLNTADKVNAITSTDYGKLLSVDATDDDKQAYLCAKTTSPKYCEHIYGTSKFVKGKLYSADLTVKELTPTAVIAYVGAIKSGVSGYETTNTYCDKFIALALENVYGTTTMTLNDARALIGTNNNWVSQHKMKIAGTTYKELRGDNGKYDEVQDNSIDNVGETPTYQMNTSNTSATSTSLRQGWRIPTVTDFRYIFQELKTGESSYVIDRNKITATTPTGITDHDGRYYSGQTDFTYTTGTGLLDYFNSLFTGTGGTGITAQFFWLGSKVINRAGDPQDGKAWRFSFTSNQFIWTESTDQSLARLVFAY